MLFRDRIGDESVQEIIQEACERAKQLPHEDFHDPWPDRRSFSTEATPVNLGEKMQEESDVPDKTTITYELHRDSKSSIVVWGHPVKGVDAGAAEFDIIRVAHGVHTNMLMRYAPKEALLRALDSVYPLRANVQGLKLRYVATEEGGTSTVSKSWYVG